MTEEWSAGNGGPDSLGACIGLEVVSWSEKKAVLRFGDDYDLQTRPWVLDSGDSYEMHVLGAELGGSVVFKGKI